MQAIEILLPDSNYLIQFIQLCKTHSGLQIHWFEVVSDLVINVFVIEDDPRHRRDPFTETPLARLLHSYYSQYAMVTFT